uniref:Uncharacterized protein n=1 Tax=Eucampia antarctica TaxID=49252 RepID=A0A7S2VZR7_9STRA|mmetsp:Transcript_14003/g.13573  ORF Transcript_14003/g.13573 Transcript_14003/m.13573 type:complete len:121 (+) Transcript_14003:118-480(+)|eukprot:CAMPEP_0197833108 /NCGR_PEP_ID=MMETSP1437-20131217/17773_1 /TAXON_ID=49252 ORGANISM="Eucampia antarctica, Strain CCMP1452" /NCGR_SAMPLE_ID=MMETSP1437 /ASSEMBLY_ACC=CAM_ASM_001096 /LENGTH=120 /DNA_ID=CAMNT_0043436947 /DNA_START=383 /DNA_END=745 /DNA_ORIENTATION=+
MDGDKEHNESNTKIDMKVEDDENYCPLFMNGLPADFANHPGLSAIASLLEEEENPKEVARLKIKTISTSSHYPKAGGGKISARKSKTQRQKISKKKPYDLRSTPQSTLGEAQLYLNLWKI